MAAEHVIDRAFAEALVTTTQTLVCVLDRDGRILLFNDACERATGYAREEVLDRDARDFVIPPEEREAFGEVLAQIWATGLPSPQIGHWMRKNGDRRLIAWSNKPVTNEEGRPIYLVTTGLDLTERARAQQDIRALEGDLEAKLHEVGQLAQEQRALRRVATLVAAEAPPERVFVAVSEECARVLEVSGSAVFRYEPDGTATVVGRYDRDEVASFPIGTSVPVDDQLSIGRVKVTGAPARTDDYTRLSGDIAATMARDGYASTVAAPIFVAGSIWGAVAVASKETLPPDREGRLGGFCELVSLAVASAQARDDVRASRARIVRAGDEARRRLERNLHDAAQQRLLSLAVNLRLARSRVNGDVEMAEIIDCAATELDLALDELRELARGLHPALLHQAGLRYALQALSKRSPIPVDVTVPDGAFPEVVEAAIYYIAAESLTNVAKHARATRARAVVSRAADGTASVEISDDGVGGVDTAGGSGIIGLRDRAEALGGSLVVESPPGRGTTVLAVLPLPEPGQE